MEERYLISDLINGVYYRDENTWTDDITKAYFFAYRETVEQFLSECDSPFILRIVEVYIKVN